MSEVESTPVDVPAAEPAPAEETTTTVDAKVSTGAIKKVDKKSLLTKFKTIIKKVFPKKVKVAATGEESEPEAAAPVEPDAAPIDPTAA